MKRRQNEANADIRAEIVKRGLWLWQVARACNVQDSTFSRWLREPLPEDDPRRIAIMKALDDMEGGGGDGTTETGKPIQTI